MAARPTIYGGARTLAWICKTSCVIFTGSEATAHKSISLDLDIFEKKDFAVLFFDYRFSSIS